MTRNIRTALGTLAPLALAALAPVARADWTRLNMTEGVTPLSRDIHALHMTIFWWCVAIGVVVFGWMIWSLVKFRKSQGAKPDVTMTHSTKAEIIWTVIPVGILVLMAVPAARTLIAIEDTRGTELSIKVTGYQWKWQYDYLGEGVSFFSSLARSSDEARQLKSGIDPKSVPDYLLDVDNPLVVPEDTKVRVLLTAQDVIHAWWVPAFGMKKDAIPGNVNELWFKVDKGKTGIYRGQCAELCGRDHGFMPVVVKVVTKEEYAAWLAERKAATNPSAAPAPAAEEAAPTVAALPTAPRG
ncbi:MAG: cytochrome c oxidase subunit II [Gammaproteobacteria bacterium]|nr:cytochrome c oxidase subunit II [Gammaproteobacteria bacterium]